MSPQAGLDPQESASKARIWERELRNVNSGSLLWLVAHAVPKMHSCTGCKYGTWFTVHHVRVRASCFAAGYHMATEGSCPHAKTFGATTAIKGLVTGERLGTGYFWFVSPVAAGDVDSMTSVGWAHVCRQGPFDVERLLAAWKSQGAPMQEARLQALLQACIA